MKLHNSGSILTSPDVLIIGGGAAGIAAAAGAAQQGATVTLLEKNAFAGGKATAAYVGTVCGLYYRSENPVSGFVHNGFPKDFALQLAANSKSQPVKYKSGLHFLPYEHFEFMLLCDEWLKKSTDSFCFHAQLHHAIAENNRIVSLSAMASNKPVNFQPKAVIDASGEDLLATLLNISAVTRDHYQAAAQVFQLSGILETDSAVLSLNMIRAVQKGVAGIALASHFMRVSIVPGTLRHGRVLLKLPLPLPVDNNPHNRTGLELFSRMAIKELVNFLKATSEAFKNCEITFVAPEAGVRTGPRHEGTFLLSGQDVLSARKQPDAIARGTWPVEYWEPGKNVEMEFFGMDDYYDIPAGAIRSKHIANLFFGGRNISADDTAIASARVIGTCLATGYAAGVLAAFNALNKPEAGAIAAVQKALSISTSGT